MTFGLSYEKATRDYRMPDVAHGSPGDFREGMSRVYRQSRKSMSPFVMENARVSHWQPIVEQLQAAGINAKNPVYAAKETAMSELLDLPGGGTGDTRSKAEREEGYLREVQKLNAQISAHPEIGISLQDPNTIDFEIFETARAADMDIEDFWKRATGLGKVGAFTGTAGSYLVDMANDPFFQLMAPAGIAASAGKATFTIAARHAILRTAGIEAMIGMGMEGWMQPQIKAFRDEAGLNYSWKQVMIAIASGAAGGAVFGAGFEGIRQAAATAIFRLDPGAAIGREMYSQAEQFTFQQIDAALERMTKSQAAELVDILGDVGVRVAPEGNEAAAQVHAQQDIVDQNPLDNGLENIERHLRADANINRVDETPLPPEPDNPKRVPADVYHHDNLDEQIYRFRPQDIESDAKTFQYKSGGDKFGVTEELKDITEWKPDQSGQVVVYEYADGRRVIADGHQRLGLAKRILSENPDQEIRLYGSLLKETDGVTPENARAIAAMKNITEGKGTEIDAAKIFRVSPEDFEKIKPSKSVRAFVKAGKELGSLSDEAFGLVVNEVVPGRYAAIVGRLVKDPEKQVAILRLLSRTEPQNITQAESIVRQALDADFAGETQVGLFGEEHILESLFSERSKINDAAQKIMRKDISSFNNLINNERRIQAEGNKLATGSNKERVATDAEILQTIQVEANRKGPLSEALTATARSFKEHGNLNRAANEFVEAVRRTAQRGDIDWSRISNEGHVSEPTPQTGHGDASLTAQTLNKFDDPHSGKGVQEQGDVLEADARETHGLKTETTPEGEQTLIEGVEPVTTREKLDIEAERPLRGGDADAPGMFDEAARAQTDLLDDIPIMNEDGTVVTKSINDVINDIDNDKKMLSRLEDCV